MRITLGHLNISRQGKEYVNEAMDNNRLSYGPFTEKFEKKFAESHGCKHAIFMNSGTSALQVALSAMKIKYGWNDGDEVLVPACTFVASSNVIIQSGLKPVFVDVDPWTYNIDPWRIREKITYRTRAIMPVHLFGLPCDMPAIFENLDSSATRDIKVIEDSCETMFAKTDNQVVGSWGDVACFSTYVAHLIVGGVGGIVTTNDDEIADLSRSLMAHGRDTKYSSIDDNYKNIPGLIERRYSFDKLGYSYRATELEAAIALSELERADETITKRRENAAYLTELLTPLSNYLQLPFTPLHAEHSFMMYPIVLRDGNINRDELLAYLEENEIETRYLMPLLSQPVYAKMFPREEEKYPVAKHITKRGFFIGMHQGLEEEHLNYIALTLSDFFQKYAEGRVF